MGFLVRSICNDSPKELQDRIRCLSGKPLTGKPRTSSCITDSSSSSSSQSISQSKNTSLLLGVLRFVTFSCRSFWARSRHRALKRSRKSDFSGSSGVLLLVCANTGLPMVVGVLEELVTRVLYWACRRAWAATTGDDLGEARGDELNGW
jgi:hypothetical protein